MNPIPARTRYVPIRQMPFCCGPASVQMVMLRKGIKLIPQEYLGYHMGLTVPPESAKHFYNVRVSETPPTKAGFGSQIQKEEFSLNTVFQTLEIPLSLEFFGADDFTSFSNFKAKLEELLATNEDVLICLHVGVWLEDPAKDHGHIMVIDGLENDEISFIDPDVVNNSHWRKAPLERIYNAVKHHTTASMGGLLWLKASA
jgi:hypothetical protein